MFSKNDGVLGIKLTCLVAPHLFRYVLIDIQQSLVPLEQGGGGWGVVPGFM